MQLEWDDVSAAMDRGEGLGHGDRGMDEAMRKLVMVHVWVESRRVVLWWILTLSWSPPSVSLQAGPRAGACLCLLLPHPRLQRRRRWQPGTLPSEAAPASHRRQGW